MTALGSAARLFTIRPRDLGLSAAHERPEALYDHAAMVELRRALAESFSGPVYYAVEVGQGDRYAPGRGRLHLHVIGHQVDGPERLSRSGAACRPVHDAEGLLIYLGKPPESYSLEAEIDATAAAVLSVSGRLPKTRGHLYSAGRFRWAAELLAISAPQCTKRETFSAAPTTPLIRSPITAPALPAVIPDQALERVVITPPTAPRIGSEITAAQLPPMVCDAAGSITDQLSRDEIGRVIAYWLRMYPERSNRWIGKDLGVRDVTVEAKRAEMEATAQIERLDKLTGQDGKSRPRTVSRPIPTPPLEPDRSDPIPDPLPEPEIDQPVVIPEAVMPGATPGPIPYRPPDRSSIRSITASEAECTSVRAYLAPTSGIDPAFTVPSALIVNSYPISAKSTTLIRPVLDGVSTVLELPGGYPFRRKNRPTARKNRSAPSLTPEARLKVCTQAVLRARSRQRPAARGPPPYPLRAAVSRFPGPDRSATRTRAKWARAMTPGRSVNSRGLLAPRMEDHRMKQHPNRRRAAATAARSGMSVARLALMPPAKRAEIMAGLNDGRLILVTSPAGQFIAPSAPAEASGNG